MALTPFVFIISFTVLLLHGVAGRKGFGPGEQEWGYVSVRPGAHMFWWLYYVTPPSGAKVNVYERPLIIWLQGGPGGSSTGIGNFQIIGPLDVEGNRRNYTWVQDYNVLFIDNPVGTGFSYVDNKTLLTTNNSEIANDLLGCIEGFLTKLPGFRYVDTYIFSQSYGGKMAAEFALKWYKAQKAGQIESKLRGVGLGAPWISPQDSVQSWASLLFSLGAVDTQGKKAIEALVLQVKNAAAQGSWADATEFFFQTQDLIDELTQNISPYNILDRMKVKQEMTRLPSLDHHMKNKVATALNVNATWGLMVADVFTYLSEDFMKSVTDIVTKLMNMSDLAIVVYNGHLDLIVATAGTVAWIERLHQDNGWENAPRTPLIVDNTVEGFKKELGKFKMYWVIRAGHNVPRENPAAMKAILDDMINPVNDQLLAPKIHLYGVRNGD